MALITMAMVAGCAPAADAPEADPTPSAESQESSSAPTPTATPDADPAAAGDLAVQSCTVIAENNFVEPGVQDALKEAAELAIAASEADPQWEPLATSVSMLAIAYVLQDTNADLLVSAKPPVVEQCNALGVAITG